MREVTYHLPTWRSRLPLVLPHLTQIQGIRYDEAGEPYLITLRHHDHAFREVMFHIVPHGEPVDEAGEGIAGELSLKGTFDYRGLRFDVFEESRDEDPD